MRPTFPALASAAALLSLATAAGAQDARMLNWPGKTQPAPAAAVVQVAAPVPPPFVAHSAGPGRVNNRYSPRGAARGFIPTAPAYAPAPTFRPAPPPMADYGPPVIPNVVKPAPPSAPVVAAAPPPAPKPIPVAAPSAPKPAPVIAAAPAPLPVTPVAPPVKAAADAGKGKAAPVAALPAAPAPGQAAAGPFIRPPSSNGPRFYSVHREFGGTPDATWRSKPAGAPTERLPSGFFAAGSAEQVEEDEPQDDAETRAAALRAAEKATKAKGKRR